MSGLLSQGTGNNELDKAIKIAGYAYDPKQDIFYSVLDSWQRKYGYCRLYDEAAAPLGMIIDCEPIFFEYNEKKWMIAFWKGQYDLVTGGEIGIYTAALDLKILGVIKGTFYHCVSDDHLLPMSFTLWKDGKRLFSRTEKHWWLTGFKLGEFSEPSELRMDITISLENEKMREAFVWGLWNAGYSLNQFTSHKNTVSLTFETPHTIQPKTRTKPTDWIIQRKNELLCLKYQEITKPFNTFQDKVSALEQKAPEIFKTMSKIGKSKASFERYETLINSFVSSNNKRGRN